MAQLGTIETRRRRRSSFLIDLRKHAARSWAAEETEQQAYTALHDKFSDVPSTKTLGRWFRDWTLHGLPEELQTALLDDLPDVAPDRTASWSPAFSSGPDSRIVLDVLAELVRGTVGTVTSITQAEAEWLVRLFYAAPGLHPLLSWRLARAYIQRIERDEPTEDLDVWVAFAPWLSDERLEAYERLKPAFPRYELAQANEVFSGEAAKEWAREAGVDSKEWMAAQGIRDEDLTTRPITTTRESARSLHWFLRVLQTKIQVVLQEAEGRRLVLSPYQLHETTDPSGAPAVYVREMSGGNLGVSSDDGRNDAFTTPEELREEHR